MEVDISNGQLAKKKMLLTQGHVCQTRFCRIFSSFKDVYLDGQKIWC